MSTVTISGPRRMSTVRRITPSDFNNLQGWSYCHSTNVMTDTIVRIGGVEYGVIEAWPALSKPGYIFFKFNDGSMHFIDRRRVYVRKG